MGLLVLGEQLKKNNRVKHTHQIVKGRLKCRPLRGGVSLVVEARIWNIIAKNLPRDRGENKTYFETKPRFGLLIIQAPFFSAGVFFSKCYFTWHTCDI